MNKISGDRYGNGGFFCSREKDFSPHCNRVMDEMGCRTWPNEEIWGFMNEAIGASRMDAQIIQ